VTVELFRQVNAQFFFNMSWESCNNYVAKRYMKEGGVEKDVYYDDIKMQMVSKRYARLYNCLAPPKGVDFLQAFVMEVERGGTTLTFAVERAMEEEGAFVKYNSNSGFVDWDNNGQEHRLTPHAFSRFTFDRSAGELMVVDIQGCDDVYTDPQIHTIDGTEFGEGNLGVGGMALFFSTSHYDTLCSRLGLLRFSLSPAEETRIGQNAAKASTPSLDPLASATQVSGVPELSLEGGVEESSRRSLRCSSVAGERQSIERAKRGSDAHQKAELLKQAEKKVRARRRSIVGVAAKMRATASVAKLLSKFARPERLSERSSETADEPLVAPEVAKSADSATTSSTDDDVYEEYELPVRALPLHLLGDDEAAATARKEAGLPDLASLEAAESAGVPRCAIGLGAFPKAVGSSIGTASPKAIGLVHAKMCEYALVGRLPLQEGQADVASAGHHLVCAAAVGEERALLDLRSLARGLPAAELLVGVNMRETDVSLLAPLLPAITARLAATGDVSSMLEMAAAAEGEECVKWLRMAVERYDGASEDEKTTLAQFGCARFQLLQKLAEALVDAGKRAEAGEAFQEASEAAMETGKTKVSMKLAARAEELQDEEDEEDAA
jgi:elongation factor 2 kinase